MARALQVHLSADFRPCLYYCSSATVYLWDCRWNWLGGGPHLIASTQLVNQNVAVPNRRSHFNFCCILKQEAIGFSSRLKTHLDTFWGPEWDQKKISWAGFILERIVHSESFSHATNGRTICWTSALATLLRPGGLDMVYIKSMVQTD